MSHVVKHAAIVYYCAEGAQSNNAQAIKEMQIYEFAFAAVHQTMCQTYNVSYITLSD